MNSLGSLFRMDLGNLRHRLLAGVLILLAILAPATGLSAQFGPLPNRGHAPQARSKEEFDAYLEIITASGAGKTVERVKSFESQYPTSELLGVAYQYEARAFQELNDFNGMLEAGRKALRANPGNLNTLMLLAPAITNYAVERTEAVGLLTEAEQYAHEALAGIERTQIPRNISAEQWQTQKQVMQAQCHEVLGLIATQRHQLPTAIDEFSTAIRLSPAPQGDQFFRLGMVYISAGEKAKAKEALLRAAELGPPDVQRRAMLELQALGTEDLPRR